MQSDRTAVVIALDTRAPGAARDFVVRCWAQLPRRASQAA